MTKLLTLADFENIYLLRHYELIDREEFRRLHDLNVRLAQRQAEPAHREQEFAPQSSACEDAK